MAWFLVFFWLVLAALYLVLGVLSWLFSARFGSKLHLAQREHRVVMNSRGDVLSGPPQWMQTKLGSGDSPDSKTDVVIDYWGDLGAYLDKTTVINTVGFVLAGLAAIVSYLVLQ
jgi:hypothetical protein